MSMFNVENIFYKYDVLKKLNEKKLFAVVRLVNDGNTEKTLNALYNGGISVAEISFTMAHAPAIMENVVAKFNDKMIIGAGTVLDAETCRIAILSGARFIVCPCFSKEVIMMANRYSVPVISGFGGISEISAALELGVNIFKLFPARNFDITYIKDIKGPFPNIGLIPMGGIDKKNIKDWITEGAFAIGISGEFMRLAEVSDFVKLEKTAAEFNKIVQ